MHDHSSPLRTWLSTMPALLVLLFTVIHGTSEITQSRLLAFGEQTWPGYAELRSDAPAPTCDPEAIGKPAAAEGGDDALLDDLLGDGPAGDEDDALLDDLLNDAPTEAAPSDDDLLDDLLDEPPPAPAGDAAPSDDDLLDDLLDDGPPPAAGDTPSDDALLDDLLGTDEDAAASAKAQAIAAAKKECEDAHARYAELQSRITPSVRAYRTFDKQVAGLTELGGRVAQPLLVLLILVCGATATYSREHIALRPVKSVRDNQVSSGSQLLINLALAACCAYHYSAQLDSGMHVEHPELPMLWAVGFVVMAGLNLRNLTRATDDLTPDGSIGHALLTPPLYATMGFISLVWFLGYEQHPAGTAIQLDRLTAQAGLYIQVGLYVWAGMLLKRTRLASLSFDILRPWRFTPELMAIIVVTASAIPTAYSGASGIFVIAAGAVIYDEMRRIGTRNQLALATTALSGSLGVVLSPCLLVVIVAALNKQVTTGELFGAGRWVFLLTAVLFAIIVLLTRRNEISFAPASEAWPATRAAMGRVVPYLVAGAAVILAYGMVLDAWINEHTAPKILLVLLIALVVLERFIVPEDQRMGTAKTLEDATAETTGHIGALLMLMALSVAFGGVVERAEVMSLVPEQIDNIWVAMSMLTVMLVCIGMVMDPYGAVILVSATIAQVAYNNGIDPLHFWMVVLVAFELGYLTPPVALNHLLTRTVVGDQADEIDVPADASFWRRHERYMLPMSVMGIALVLVAFGPLMLG